jgi:hypothetical protein
MADFAGAIREQIVLASEAYRRAREQWRDSVADDFHRSHWRDIDSELRAFARDCDRFETVLRRAEQAIR